MRAIRSFIVLLGVFFSCLALLAPFLSIDVPWGSEVWLFPSIQELGRVFHVMPVLNGLPFSGPDPLVPVLLSLLPFSDLMSLRVVSILFGSLVALSVFVFCSSLWDLRAGFCSALFTMTTWGFAAMFSTVNPTFLPVSLTVLAFLLFSQIYIKELNPWWYLLAYLLMCLAVLTGGWTPLAFFVFSVVLLILLDTSPKRFLSIRPAWGAMLIGGVMVAAYVAFWVLESSTYARSVFDSSSGMGLLARIWLWLKFNLPWILLVIPAWSYTEGPKEAASWRALLAPKTAYALGFVTMLFSSHAQEGYAFLSIPFGGILIGYWMSRGFLIREGLQTLRSLTAAGTAAIIIAAGLYLIITGSLLDFSLDIAQGAVAAAFLAVAGLLLFFAGKRHTMAMAALGMISVFALSWYAALVLVPRSAEKPASYARQVSAFSPLLVFQEDITMRGYASYAGGRAVVVGEKMVPVGYTAYLAVSTNDLEALRKDLATRMQADVISFFKQRKTYALIRVSPAAPRQ